MTWKRLAAIIAASGLALGGAFYAGRYTAPAKTITTKVEKEAAHAEAQAKTDEQKGEVIARHIVIREAAPVPVPVQPKPVAGCPACVECPPVPVKETVIDETVVSNTHTTSEESSTVDVARETKTTEVVVTKRADLSIGVNVQMAFHDLRAGKFDPTYGGEVAVRVAGPAWVALQGNTEVVVLGLRMEL